MSAAPFWQLAVAVAICLTVALLSVASDYRHNHKGGTR